MPGLPPDWEIEFAIELVPGTAPISKLPDGSNRTSRIEKAATRIIA